MGEQIEYLSETSQHRNIVPKLRPREQHLELNIQSSRLLMGLRYSLNNEPDSLAINEKTRPGVVKKDSI